jgi:hypothetical protein
MTLLFLLAACLLVGALARRLLSYLGWPTNGQAVGRWLFALLLIGVLLRALPELPLGDVTSRLPPSHPNALPTAAILGFVALAFVGWAAWRSRWDVSRRAQHPDRFTVRRRALPPPPQGPADEQ